MDNKLFYKVLATLSTLGILSLSFTQIWTSIKKSNTTESEINKTLNALKKSRKDALAEVENIKKLVLDEMKSSKKETFAEFKTDKTIALQEIKQAKIDALQMINNAGGGVKNKYWLVLRLGNSGREMGNAALAPVIEKIPMETMEQCQLQGSLLKSTKEMNAKGVRIGFECVEGI